MKKLIKLEFDNTTRERKTEDSYSELYSHDKNNGSFEFEILNDTLTTEQVIALFKFTESNKIWKTTGTIEGNKVKVTFDTTLITQNETVICYLYFDEEQRTSDTFRFKFKVKVSEIDKMNRYEVKERFINNTVIVDRLDVVTKDELKEALKNVGGIATEGLLTEVKAEELYAKKSEAVDNTNFELVKNRILALELKTDKDTVYDDSELKGRISVLEAKEDNNTIYDDTNVRERLTALESKPNVDVTNLVTKDELESKHYLTTHQSLDHVVTKDELASKNYLTEHQPLTEVNNRLDVLEARPIVTPYNDTALSDRVTALETKQDKDTVYNDTELRNRVEVLENKPNVDLTNYITSEQLENKHYLTQHQPLDNLVTKEELNNKGYVTDEVLNSKGYLTEHQNISHLVTRDELNGKGYLTEETLNSKNYLTEDVLNTKNYLTQHQDLSSLVTKQELENKHYLTEHQPLTHLATTSDLEALRNIAVSKSELNNKLDTTEFNSFKDSVVTKSELAEKGYISDLSNYVTKQELHEATEIDYSNIVTTDELEPYAKKSELPQPYNDTEVKQRLTALENRPSTGGGAQTKDTGWITISEEAPLNGNIVRIRRVNDMVYVSLNNPDTENTHLQLEVTDGHGAVLAEKEIQKGFTPMRTVIVPVISNIETIMLSTDLNTTGQAVFNVVNNRVTLKAYDKDITSGIPTSKHINDFSYFTEDPFPTNLH